MVSDHQIKTTPLNDLVSDIFDGPRRIRFVQDGAPYIRLGDLGMGEIYKNPNRDIAPLDLDHRLYLCDQDVLVTKTGDEPRASMMTKETVGGVISPDIYCIRTNSDRLSATWLAYYLNTAYGQRQLIERSSVATLRRLRIAELRSMPVILPKSDLVQEIEALEKQAHIHAQKMHEIWAAILNGVFAEINERSGLTSYNASKPLDDFLASPVAQQLFRPLGEVARLSVSSRKMLKPDQRIQYVQTSDIDPESFLFRRVRSAVAQDLPTRIRLPLQAYQVLLLASGSNLGTTDHSIAVVDEKLDGGFASNAFLALDFHETPIYYAISLKHPLVLEQIRRIAIGEVVSTLRKKEIIHIRIPVLSAVWRQDFNDRAKIAWERRALAMDLRRQALVKAQNYIQNVLRGANQ